VSCILTAILALSIVVCGSTSIWAQQTVPESEESLEETLAKINAEFDKERKDYPQVFVDVEKAANEVAEPAFKAGVVDPEKRINAYWTKNKGRITKKFGKKGAEIFQFHFEIDAVAKLDELIEEQTGKLPMLGFGQMGKDPHKQYYLHLEAVKSAIRENMHDPRSFRLVQEPSLKVTYHNGQYYWAGDLKFRGKNAFGATVLNSVKICVQKYDIVHVEAD
jgi:hypothetical protein